MGTLKAFDTLLFGQKTVTTAGTAEILVAATPTHSITIKALETNSGDIYVGDSSVTSSNGYPMSAGETASIDIDHEQDNIYIDVDNDGEGVAYIGGTLS